MTLPYYSRDVVRKRFYGKVGGNHVNLAHKILINMKGRMELGGLNSMIDRAQVDGVLYEVVSHYGQDEIRIIAPGQGVSHVTESLVNDVKQDVIRRPTINVLWMPNNQYRSWTEYDDALQNNLSRPGAFADGMDEVGVLSNYKGTPVALGYFAPAYDMGSGFIYKSYHPNLERGKMRDTLKKISGDEYYEVPIGPYMYSFVVNNGDIPHWYNPNNPTYPVLGFDYYRIDNVPNLQHGLLPSLLGKGGQAGASSGMQTFLIHDTYSGVEDIYVGTSVLGEGDSSNIHRVRAQGVFNNNMSGNGIDEIISGNYTEVDWTGKILEDVYKKYVAKSYWYLTVPYTGTDHYPIADAANFGAKFFPPATILSDQDEDLPLEDTQANGREIAKEINNDIIALVETFEAENIGLEIEMSDSFLPGQTQIVGE